MTDLVTTLLPSGADFAPLPQPRDVLPRNDKPTPGGGYLAGAFPGGITKVEGQPAPALIRIIHRPTGVLVAEVASAADGTWRVEGLDPALKFDVICRQPGYNDMILADVSPVAL